MKNYERAALRLLERAMQAPRWSKKQQAWLECALAVYEGGKVGGVKGKLKIRVPRGRRKGTTGAYHDDAAALQLMTELSEATGELRLRTLARLAVDAGGVKLNGADRDSVIRRLALRRKQLCKK